MEEKTTYYDWHPEEVQFMDYMQFFLSKKPVLDIGCGEGWTAKFHKHLYGIDIDSAAIKKAKKIMVDAKVANIDGNKIPYGDNFFEGVIAKDIIEHLKENSFFVRDIHRVLKKNGVVYIATKMPIPDFWSDYTHIRPYNKQALRSILEDNGFEVKKMWYTGNWPGLGILMRLFKLHKTPGIFTWLCSLGLNRNNINVVAVKK